MAYNGYASLFWADVWEEGETEAKIDGNCTFFPIWQKGDLLWKNHDLCQRQEGYQVEQGMEVWANNDKCLQAHPTPIHSSQVEGSIRYDQWWWSSAALRFPLLSIPSLLWRSSAFAAQNSHAAFHASPLSPFFLSSSSSPPFFCCCLFHVSCLYGDQSCCPWWIQMIHRFREHRARQSPLSCDWAICLCQTSPVHATRPDSEQVEDRQWIRGMSRMAYGKRSNIKKERKIQWS